MTAFRRSTGGGVTLWVGRPNCQAAHDAILKWLRSHVGTFLPRNKALNTAIMGNLGETIAFVVGVQHDFSGHFCFAANAFDPLNRISRSFVDLVWLAFGKTTAEDVVFVQEVKTTVDSSLSLANELAADYYKLFGNDPALTLHTRLQAIKNELEYTLHRPKLCVRLSALAGKSPETSAQVRLVPTLVHGAKSGKAQTKMTAVRAVLSSNGWPASSVTAWSIRLSALQRRLSRLAHGRK